MIPNFDYTKPDGTLDGATTLDQIRNAMQSLEISTLAFLNIGWSAITEVSPENPEIITAIIQKKVSEWIRIEIEYNLADMPSKVVYKYSEDQGINYTIITTETIAYDENDNITEVVQS